MEQFYSHMKTRVTSITDYLVLFTCSIFFLLFLKMFQGEKVLSFLVLLTFVSFYILWGIVHHMREKTLHLKNVIEYTLIGFAILVVLTAAFSF